MVLFMVVIGYCCADKPITHRFRVLEEKTPPLPEIFSSKTPAIIDQIAAGTDSMLSESTGVVEAICLARLNEVPCMCSCWMQGGTLREQMTAKTLTPTALLNSLCRVLHTLNWVHKRHKAIHRDLKPENILFDERGLAYVSDWGLAKLCDEQMRKVTGEKRDFAPQNPVLTQAGSFLGTVMYASPEQILGHDKIDHRSDIYSLGCIIYEMEVGHPPFGGRTMADIAIQHLRSVPPRFGVGRNPTTLGLETVVEHSGF